MLGVVCDEVPRITSARTVGIIGVVVLLLGDEGPFLIELDLAGPGGKSHQLVVGALGVPAGQEGQPRDRVLIDAHEPRGLADATPLGQVFQDGQCLVVRQPGVEERRLLVLLTPAWQTRRAFEENSQNQVVLAV